MAVMLVVVSYLAILTAALAQLFYARVTEQDAHAEDEVLRRLRGLNDRRLERRRHGD